MKYAPIGIVLSLAIGLTGCSSGGGGGSSGGNNSTGTTYSSVAQNTLPVLSSAIAKNLNGEMRAPGDPSWMSWGEMADEAAFLFLDPAVWEVNGYSLGVNNIYHLLNDFGTIPTSAANTFTSVATIPWFDSNPAGGDTFFPAAFTKNYTELQNSENYVAKNGNIVETMRAFNGGGGSRSSTVFQVRYDSDTDAMQARMQGTWDYTADYSNAFVMRFEFFGNPATHEFTLRATKWSSITSPPGYYLQIVGTGVSQGTGTHFLLKMADNSMNPDKNALNAPKYFCYSADTQSATDVTATIGTSPCAAYQTTVDAIQGLIYTDMPTTNIFDVTVTTQ